ncbi:MAG: dephospho-CoA kinase [Vicinamibacterales bacterium]|nr:dephospho-CoA kinase [Vicinamibacterales bacterium]HJN44249.1 dephospho-CoA kinase [Vicinamibacterales bacterium]
MGRVRRVVLTGGVATGKSYVLEQFAALGVPTADADQLAHTTYAPNGPAWRAVRERFGPGIFDERGLVDRRALGSLVFADETARSALNAIVHPHVRIAITTWFANLDPDPTVPFGIVAIPLFYETPRTEVYHRVIVTACRDEAQLARVMARGLSEHEATQRIAAQLSTTEKVQKADYAIWTDDTHAETARRVSEIFRTLGKELADPQETGDS